MSYSLNIKSISDEGMQIPVTGKVDRDLTVEYYTCSKEVSIDFQSHENRFDIDCYSMSLNSAKYLISELMNAINKIESGV
jgi:hypothetical protein